MLRLGSGQATYLTMSRLHLRKLELCGGIDHTTLVYSDEQALNAASINSTSFLRTIDSRSSKTVVEHLLGLFRRVRSLTSAAKIPDERTTDIFLATLCEMMMPENVRDGSEVFGLSGDAVELKSRLDQRGISAAINDIQNGSGSLALLRLHPELAVRHAGGQLFQEAHFELLRAPTSLDLFSIVGDAEVTQTTRGGTHYTPPALARILVEQVLGTVPNISARPELILCDPACGSGAFLHEALRSLRRIGFNGKLKIIGQDISDAAIAMARFVLNTSIRDWSPWGGCNLQLRTGDSLGELGIPSADIIVMNPPFISFGAQTAQQREQLREVMGGAGSARGDLSMAFILRAMDALQPNGVLGALFPASLLSLKAAATWRERLTESGDFHLLASIGDFGLFTHAQVQVACAAIRKGKASPPSEAAVLITKNDVRATADAFRWLRKCEVYSTTHARLRR